ncbi:MAG: hypothetical protein K0U66_07580 [Gammaproteobacteria bacterium]|nr:hypothetical protein [Gammaproteobacteria bacterium]
MALLSASQPMAQRKADGTTKLWRQMKVAGQTSSQTTVYSITAASARPDNT